MPIVLAPDVVVEVEPPNVPVLYVAPPALPTVAVQPPGVPVISSPSPSPPDVTLVPVVGPPGPPGPRGPAGGGSVFEFQQTIPQSVWVVNHGFGRYPVAWSLFDANGRLCDEYIIEHTDVDTCRVSMDVATAGLIRLI